MPRRARHQTATVRSNKKQQERYAISLSQSWSPFRRAPFFTSQRDAITEFADHLTMPGTWQRKGERSAVSVRRNAGHSPTRNCEVARVCSELAAFKQVQSLEGKRKWLVRVRYRGPGHRRSAGGGGSSWPEICVRRSARHPAHERKFVLKVNSQKKLRDDFPGLKSEEAAVLAMLRSRVGREISPQLSSKTRDIAKTA